MVHTYVSDTGTGISEDKLPKLFEPFERLGLEQSKIEGTGIGLTISKKLVEAMGEHRLRKQDRRGNYILDRISRTRGNSYKRNTKRQR